MNTESTPESSMALCAEACLAWSRGSDGPELAKPLALAFGALCRQPLYLCYIQVFGIAPAVWQTVSLCT